MTTGSEDGDVAETESTPAPSTGVLQGLFGLVQNVAKRLPPSLAYGLTVAVVIVVLALITKGGGVLRPGLIWLFGVVVCLVLVVYVFTEWNRRAVADAREPELFSDTRVNDIAQHLSALDVAFDRVPIPRESILPELRALFDRKTFTEPLKECPNQLWADRLDSCYQTLRLLQLCERKVKASAPDLAAQYIELRTEVDRYGMQMGACLFDPEVDYSKVEHHIGKATFKKNLPPQHIFPKLPNGDPNIPDVIADAIEKHRLRSVELKDRLK